MVIAVSAAAAAAAVVYTLSIFSYLRNTAMYTMVVVGGWKNAKNIVIYVRKSVRSIVAMDRDWKKINRDFLIFST